MRETILPLTDQESDFAAQNYNIVREYLNIRRHSFDEWHDVVIFRYLRSVHRWFTIPELQRYKFKRLLLGLWGQLLTGK